MISHLLENGERVILGLLQHFHEALAEIELEPAWRLIEVAAELGEGLQFAELCQVEAQGSVPDTFFIALTWALPPTRDTEIPAFMAGRTPE